MKRILANLILSAVTLGFATVAPAATDEAKATYKAAKDSAGATYKRERAKCDALSGNPKDVCIEAAKAAEKRSKAEAEAQYKNTSKAHMNARIAAADGDYAVAKEKCNAHSGNAKDVCKKEAKAVHSKAVADAKSSKKADDLKAEGTAAARDAAYQVEIKECDALAGPDKEACIASANVKYDK